MIISTKYKFIFIHNPKAAGTSISKSLRKYDEPKFKNQSTQHETITELKLRTNKNYENYLIFGITRNPWDRISSLYNYLKKQQQKHKFIKHIKNLDEFIQALYNDKLPNLKSLIPQHKYFDDNVILGRYENLNDDINNILNKINIQIKLPHYNKSNNLNYKLQYKQTNSIKIIENHYKIDINKYNYSF